MREKELFSRMQKESDADRGAEQTERSVGGKGMQDRRCRLPAVGTGSDLRSGRDRGC